MVHRLPAPQRALTDHESTPRPVPARHNQCLTSRTTTGIRNGKIHICTQHKEIDSVIDLRLRSLLSRLSLGSNQPYPSIP